MSFVIVRAAGSSGGGGGGSGDTTATNVHGNTSGLAPTAVATLCSQPIVGWKYRGFVAYGDTDGLVWLEVDGTPVPGQTARLSRVKTPKITLPNPEQLVGTTASLKVMNEGDVSGSFEATMFGE